MIIDPEECICTAHTPTSAGVAINWSHNLKPGAVDRALFVFTNLATGSQTQVEVPPYRHYCFSLNAGRYRVAVLANGCERYTGLVELTGGRMVPLTPVLNPRTDVSPTLKDVLVELSLPDPNVTPRDLDVPPHTTVTLDAAHPPYKQDWQMVQIKDVDAAKRILGHRDELWGIQEPRFSSLAPHLISSPRDLAAATAKEYIYGYSGSVVGWKQLINDIVFGEVWGFPAFVYGTVTINAGGVLVIGNGSSLFICQRLRMHVTATLRIIGTGPVVVRPLSYESFC